MSGPFDEAIEERDLQDAARVYASRHGKLGSPAYNEAWFRFRRQVRSGEDLRRARARAAARRAAADDAHSQDDSGAS